MTMIPFNTPLLALAGALTLLFASSGSGQDRQGVQRMIVRDEILMHVPITRRSEPRVEWIERKGPKCLPSQAIAGAAIAGPSAIDFVLRDRRRVRAELDSDCAGLDFYGGFYVEPQDEELCAKREEIRSRMGGSCRIERFRALQAKLRD